MTTRDEVARRVAERLRLPDPTKANRPMNTPIPLWEGFQQTWDALLSSEQRVEELEEALRKQVRHVHCGVLSEPCPICEESEAALSTKEKK